MISSNKCRLLSYCYKTYVAGYFGYLPQAAASFASSAAEAADKRFFLAIEARPDLSLRPLLPCKKLTMYSIRPREHLYELPLKDTGNLSSRVLYDELYC